MCSIIRHISENPPAKLVCWRSLREHRSAAQTQPADEIGGRRDKMQQQLC